MTKKKIVVAMLFLVMILLLAGCSKTGEQTKDAISVTTDNGISVNVLTSLMDPLSDTQKDGSILDSIKAKVSNGEIDFSSITRSGSSVYIDEVVYVEGVIPQTDYPGEKVHIKTDPESIVDIENAIVTNKDDTTVLTFEVVGKQAGTATVMVDIEDSQYYHSFDIEVLDNYVKSTPDYSSYTVYCTPTGGKYHAYGCSYLRGNGIAIGLQEALAKGLGACSRCHP